jgi:hypothetical protein
VAFDFGFLDASILIFDVGNFGLFIQCAKELEEEKRHMEEHMHQKVTALEQMFQDQMSELMRKLAEKGSAEPGNSVNVENATNAAHWRKGGFYLCCD